MDLTNSYATLEDVPVLAVAPRVTYIINADLGRGGSCVNAKMTFVYAIFQPFYSFHVHYQVYMRDHLQSVVPPTSLKSHHFTPLKS